MSVNDRFGAFLPTTTIFEIEDIQNISINSPEFKDFLIRLRQSVNNLSLMVNIKETAIYDPTEIVSGKVWFPDPALTSKTPKKPIQRQGFRKVIDFGSLPNTGTKSVAHGITFPSPDTYQAIEIYGTATDPTSSTNIPLPYASPVLANNIELRVDATNIIITTGSDRTSFTKSSVVFEFIKE